VRKKLVNGRKNVQHGQRRRWPEMAIEYVTQAAGCLDFASSIEEALRQIRAMVWEEVYLPTNAAYKPLTYPWDGWEGTEVLSQGVSLPAPNPAKEAAYQAAAARNKDTPVGRISRKLEVA
jgi:hypothetical protein